MRQDLLRDKAITLQNSLQKYASQSTEAEEALSSLRVLLKQAITGQITKEMDWKDVPCGYMFLDSELVGFTDLSEAYADFKIEVTGKYNSPVLATIREISSQKK